MVSKSKGGSNKKYNIIKICQICHRKIHMGEIIIEGKFLTTNGYQILFTDELKEDVYIFGKNRK